MENDRVPHLHHVLCSHYSSSVSKPIAQYAYNMHHIHSYVHTLALSYAYSIWNKSACLTLSKFSASAQPQAAKQKAAQEAQASAQQDTSVVDATKSGAEGGDQEMAENEAEGGEGEGDEEGGEGDEADEGEEDDGGEDEEGDEGEGEGDDDAEDQGEGGESKDTSMEVVATEEAASAGGPKPNVAVQAGKAAPGANRGQGVRGGRGGRGAGRGIQKSAGRGASSSGRGAGRGGRGGAGAAGRGGKVIKTKGAKVLAVRKGVVPTKDDVESDKLTKLAQAHWAGKNPKPFDPALIDRIYSEELKAHDFGLSRCFSVFDMLIYSVFIQYIRLFVGRVFVCGT
jgi:hypothetical protein